MGSREEFERFVDMLSVQEATQEERQPARVEPLVAHLDIGDWPPLEAEIGRLLIV